MYLVSEKTRTEQNARILFFFFFLGDYFGSWGGG